MFINKNYFLIWSGKFVSMIGDRFYTLVLALWVLKKSESPMMMGAVLIASTLPAFIVGFFAGTYVDMKNKKFIMIVTDLIRGVLILSVAYLEYLDHLDIQLIIIVSMIISAINAFFEPSIKALIPDVVKANELARANALEQLINGISSVVGPILGAVAIGLVGFFGGFLINGISFVLSAIFEIFIKVDYYKNESKAAYKFIDNMKEGYAFVIKKQLLLEVLSIIAVVHFAVGSFTLILPFFANTLSGNDIALGLLQGFFGMGLIIGATVLNIAKRKEMSVNVLVISTGILGICYGLFAILNYLSILVIIPYLIIVLLMGITISNAATFWQLILQRNTPEQMRGIVFSLVMIILSNRWRKSICKGSSVIGSEVSL